MNWELKKRIVEKFGTQFEFALCMRQREVLVSQVIRGRVRLDLDRQQRWASALGCEVEEIFEDGKNANQS